jgi:hypothetical protein
VFKGAATTVIAKPNPLREHFEQLVANGTKAHLARLTIARRIAAATLETGIAVATSLATRSAQSISSVLDAEFRGRTRTHLSSTKGRLLRRLRFLGW